MKKAILTVSFGTTFETAIKSSIAELENTFANEFPTYEVRRAFTSNMIIKSLKTRGVNIDTVAEALEKLAYEKYDEVIVQPTHIINGIEYDKMCISANAFRDKFSILKIGVPLLNSKADIEKLCCFYEKTFDQNSAVAVMGHGTEHEANRLYKAFAEMCVKLNYTNLFMGTVEAEPSIEDIIPLIKRSGYKKVICTPFMLVAGDHANNDMAGDSSDSWKSILEENGFEVTAVIKGLGEYEEIRMLYTEHLGNTIGGK